MSARRVMLCRTNVSVMMKVSVVLGIGAIVYSEKLEMASLWYHEAMAARALKRNTSKFCGKLLKIKS